VLIRRLRTCVCVYDVVMVMVIVIVHEVIVMVIDY
jgi:hypothetical protein